ncbi:class I SAM-dependent methyltransferase [Kutzneria sp. CA-103260]|uniref:class I SAM-dependent methyltransferase n=1 Tax=Kutzneria sp. CA-103260 TaxID=2802641 RepID=UPI001BA43F9B|nr:class I SAM-dependent methyltransferase [Kutzneria sp. CA-103260]QUQ66773.1 Trans-aconitate 2-methyltransferase [Kutzneria sp. CA-103260]
MTDATTRFGGFADEYDRVRPTPPAVLTELITQWAGVTEPDVVDLGAGTGLATALWPAAIGVEPDPGMRAIAAARGLRVVDGTAEATTLPDNCADVVTASQALHWFDPARAFPEVARILRPGGVFAAFDCEWPPAVDPECDAAYRSVEDHYRVLEVRHHVRPPYAAKADHAARLRDSGLFRHVTEVAVHAKDIGDAARFVDILRSQGGVVALLERGITEDEIGLTRLREVAQRRIPTPRIWWWTYRVRLAVA